MSVLVIDDDELVLRMFGRVLRKHELTLVGRAQEALERIQAGEAFDVILCDVHMPAMGGVAFHEELARRQPALADRVVFMAGGSSSDEDEAFFEVHDVLMKPFRLAEFEDRVLRLGALESGTRMCAPPSRR
ncbi:MAG TPA: response regulator [Polyangiaceae bacterium]